jgi:hypothetical protein
VHVLDAKKDPEMPVIVVGLNERVDNEGNLLKNMILVDGVKKNRSASGRTAIDTRGPYNRDAVNFPVYQETLESAGFKSMTQLRRYEDWVSGRVELQLEIVKLDKTTTESHLFQGSQRDWDHEHWIGVTIFTWDYNVNGDRVKYHWAELDDAGESINIQISLSGYIVEVPTSTEATLNIDANDDRIGDSTIHFMDAIPGRYMIANAFSFTTVQY